MSTEENKDIVRRLVDAINNQSLDEPVIWQASVLTELHISIEDIIAEGDKVVARLLRQGTHQGWLDVEATGKPTTTHGIYIFRVAGGKLVEAWDTWDELGLLEQIGAVWKVEASEEAGSA
jgi:ketosteroid isomerase-like protein